VAVRRADTEVDVQHRTRTPRGAGATRRRPKPPYHHGNLRAALIEAALTLVAEQGADALTLRAAARLAGVSQAAPYRHFADKDALLAAVAEEGFRAMSEAMRRRRDAGETPLERLRAVGLEYVTFATEHPAHFRVMFGRVVADRARYPALDEAAAETFGLLVDGIAACQQEGMVREGDPRELALTAWSVVHGCSMLAVDDQFKGLSAASTAELAEAVTRDLFLGLAPRG
jgi:AcrR family transcriptional regulator